MAFNNAYFVKREFRLFGKRPWTVIFGDETIGMFDDRTSAVALATQEAKRTAGMGRQSEVWVNDGEGFLLVASLGGKDALQTDDIPKEPPRDDLSLF